ncbi:MAG: hypothetical protein ACLQRH_22965 [Acidimicrobiales bacterium]
MLGEVAVGAYLPRLVLVVIVVTATATAPLERLARQGVPVDLISAAAGPWAGSSSTTGV